MKPFAAWMVCTFLIVAMWLWQPRLARVEFIPEYPLPPQLPKNFGEWIGERMLYCQASTHGEKAFFEHELTAEGRCPECGGTMGPMSAVERRLLPPDTRLDKMFYKSPRLPEGAAYSVAVVFSGRHRNSIHRPEVCLVGDGSTSEITRSERRAARLDRTRTLQYTFLNIRRKVPAETGNAAHHEFFFAYWFIGHGVETPSHITRMFWMGLERLRGKAYPWAYVSVSGNYGPTGQRVAIERLESFLGELHAALHGSPQLARAAHL